MSFNLASKINNLEADLDALRSEINSILQFSTGLTNYYTSSQTDAKISTALVPYVNTLVNATTDSNALISLSKSTNVLTFNYNNLITRLSTYQTTSTFDSSIALKADKSTTYTKTEVESAIALNQSQIGIQISTTLIPYVNTLSVTTTNSNTFINLTKSNNTLTFNYDNLITKLGTYQTTSAFNSSIANYYTSSQTDSKISTALVPYVNTLINATTNSNSLFY